jgi:hypothetical protein
MFGIAHYCRGNLDAVSWYRIEGNLPGDDVVVAARKILRENTAIAPSTIRSAIAVT